MGRLVWLMPFLLAGCSTAPVAGFLDTLDSHHWDKRDRARVAPPPTDYDYGPPSVGIFEPTSRSRGEATGRRPPSDEAEPYDVPIQPARRKEKPFEPKDKVKATPATRTRDRDPQAPDDNGRFDDDPRYDERLPDDPPRRDTRPRGILSPPRPPSDERYDF